MIKVAVLTISDSCSQGNREDVSGQTIEDMLAAEEGFEVCEYKIVPDDTENIKKELIRFADEVKVDIILTTGGTGLGPRDITPEATIAISERQVPGLAELIRAEGLKKTKNAVLSRGISVIRGKTLIINFPGSPKAVQESLETVFGVLGHAISMLSGGGH